GEIGRRREHSAREARRDRQNEARDGPKLCVHGSLQSSEDTPPSATRKGTPGQPRPPGTARSPAGFPLCETPPPLTRSHPLPPLSPGFVGIIAFKCLKAAAFLLLGAVAFRIARLPHHSEPLEIARLLGVNTQNILVQHLSFLL